MAEAEIMKLEDKINGILALNYKADVAMYRERAPCVRIDVASN